MAKEPDDRYTTCAALITAAEEALGLRRPPALRPAQAHGHRCRGDLSSSSPRRSQPLCSFEATATAAWPRRPSRQTRSSASTLRRTRSVRSSTSAASPSATAVGGRSVWVYNYAGPSVSEIDAATRHRPAHDDARRRRPADPACLHGAGAGRRHAPAPGSSASTARGRSYLTRVFSGRAGSASTGSSTSPVRSRSATAPSGSSLAAHATTRCCASTRPPAGSPSGRASPPPRRSTVSPPALAASGSWPRPPQRSTGSTLARHAVTGRLDLGSARRPTRGGARLDLGRPVRRGEVTRSSSTLGRSDVVGILGCCPPERGYDTAGYGSLWAYDAPSGTVVRLGRSDPSGRLRHPGHGSAVSTAGRA